MCSLNQNGQYLANIVYFHDHHFTGLFGRTISPRVPQLSDMDMVYLDLL